MTNNKDDVYKNYDKIVDWFNENRRRDLFEKIWLDKVITLMPMEGNILDLGCGIGHPIGQYFIDAGFHVTGVDASSEMLNLAKASCPKIKFILSDMRGLHLNEKFDGIVAWHSLFHLSPDNQREMFKTFFTHLRLGGILLFTSGSEAGEVWSENGGENLYHASLSPEEYKILLKQYDFTLIDHKISDPECHGATVWLARFGECLKP